MKSCLNCDAPRLGDSTYCTACGQAYKDAQLSFWQVAKSFLSNVFTLDNKLWLTLYALIFPARLAIYYIAGKRKSYIAPGRLFFIGLVLHIATLSILLRAMEDDIGNSNDSIYQQAEHIRLTAVYDSLATIYIPEQGSIDTLRSQLFKINTDKNEITVGEIDMISAVVSDYDISSEDIATLDADFIIDKYEIEGFWDKILVRQGIRVNADVFGVLKSFVGNIFWLIAVMVFITALILKMLYLRHQIYLTEHLVLSAYTHAWQLIIGSLLCAGLVGYCLWQDDLTLIIDYLEDSPAIPIYILVLGMYSLVAMRSYYQEGWVLTFVKWLIASAAYLVLGLLVFVVIFGITVLIF